MDALTQAVETVQIYGLFDPRHPDVIRYIGKTKEIKKRLRSHLVEAKRNGGTYKRNWIRSLLADGITPFTCVLTEVPINTWTETERMYISKFKETLTNATCGGEGHEPSEETKRKISAALKGRIQLPEIIQKRANSNRGKKRSLKTRFRLAEASRGKRSPETCKKISEGHKRSFECGRMPSRGMLGKKHTAEWRLNASNLMKKRVPYKPTEDDKKKMSVAHLGKVLSPEIRLKMSESARKAWIKRKALVSSIELQL